MRGRVINWWMKKKFFCLPFISFEMFAAFSLYIHCVEHLYFYQLWKKLKWRIQSSFNIIPSIHHLPPPPSHHLVCISAKWYNLLSVSGGLPWVLLLITHLAGVWRASLSKSPNLLIWPLLTWRSIVSAKILLDNKALYCIS